MRLLVFMLGLLAVGVVSARQIAIGDMVDKAHFIMVARVLDAEQRPAKVGKMIFTDYQLEIKETIKGRLEGKPVLSFAGGTLGDKTIRVTGVPSLVVGSTYLLFGYNGNYAVPIVGNDQGIIEVVEDATDGRRYLLDYRGRQIEESADGRIYRGKLAAIDGRGKIVDADNGNDPTSPRDSGAVVRDWRGQPVAAFELPVGYSRRPVAGNPVTLADFLQRIQKDGLHTGGK